MAGESLAEKCDQSGRMPLAHHLSQHFRRSFGHPYPAFGHFNPPPPGRPICAYVNSSGINCFRCLSFSAKANSHSGPGVLVPRLRSPQDLGHPQAICMQVLVPASRCPRFGFDGFLTFIFDLKCCGRLSFCCHLMRPVEWKQFLVVSPAFSLKLKTAIIRTTCPKCIVFIGIFN